MKAQIKLNIEDEIFDVATRQEMRAKAKNLVRSEFDRVTKEEVDKTIKFRLDNNRMLETQIKIELEKIVQNYLKTAWHEEEITDHVPKSTGYYMEFNPIKKMIEDAVAKHMPPKLESFIKAEATKQFKKMVSKMAEAGKDD